MTTRNQSAFTRVRRKAWVSPVLRRLGAGAAELTPAGTHADLEGLS